MTPSLKATSPALVVLGDHEWYKLLVINSRFPEFAEALGWSPSPGQL